jgi:hypothetical protein
MKRFTRFSGTLSSQLPLLTHGPARTLNAKRFGNRFSTSEHLDRGTSRIAPEIVFEDVIGELKRASGAYAWGCCPFHDDEHPSFCCNIETGWYACKASHCAVTGDNIVSFVGRLLGLSYLQSLEYLEQRYG